MNLDLAIANGGPHFDIQYYIYGTQKLYIVQLWINQLTQTPSIVDS